MKDKKYQRAFLAGWYDAFYISKEEIKAERRRLHASMKRAAAAGREGVASHRQADIETCTRLLKTIRLYARKQEVKP